MSSEGCCVTVACEGCLALLVIDERRRWVVRLRRGGVLGSDRGVVRHDDVIGREYGSWLETSRGVPVLLLQPRLVDLEERLFRRRSQVIYPKDHGLIAVELDLKPGMRVLEVGVGSGFTTAFLAQLVGPTGHVYSYELRRDMIEVAERNLRQAGLLDRVTLKHRDARLGVDETGLDAAVVDMPDPWALLPVLEQALRPGATAAFYMPAINQVQRLLAALKARRRWAELRVTELLRRDYETRSDALRPRTTMIAHTGYLAFARLTKPPQPPEGERGDSE